MSLSPEARHTLTQNADLFIAEYFKHRLEKLEPFHLDLIRTAINEVRGLVLFPAGHGKTTIVSELLPIWEICRDPNIRLANIAKNEDDAQAITRSIQSELVQNDRLIQDFGPFKPEGEGKAWSLSRFDVQGRTRRGKSATFIAFGAGGRGALGYRTDHTTCDDVVTDVNSATPEQRGKLREWFNQGPETMGDHPSSRLTVVGTLFHPEDLYHDLMEAVLPDNGQAMYTVSRYSAILDWEKQQVLWPEYRPWLWLMQRKLLMGTLDFNKRFMNIAVDPSRQVFKWEYVHGGYVNKVKYDGCLDRQHVVGDYADDWRRVAGFDPAVGTKSRSAKFCAHLVLAAGSCAKHERCYWVIDLERDQMTLPKQVETIIAKHEKYDLQASLIEANSYQAGLYQAVQDKMNDQGIRLAMEPHYTTRGNKPDPELGVQSMSPWFENGQVHIPWGNPESQRKMNQLVDELVTYPGRTTDTVMALWFAWKRLQETAPKFVSFNRLSKDPKRQFWGRKPMAGRMIHNPFYDRPAA